MPSLSASERALAGRKGGYTSWANTPNRAARTLPGRDAFDRRFEVQVDPEGTLSADERAKRADAARRAYFADLALRSARARGRRKDTALAAELHEAAKQLETGAA